MLERSSQSYPVRRLPSQRDGPRGLPQLYRGARSRHALRDVYTADHGEGPGGGRFRWLLSTILAATVGTIAILVVIYGSADREDSNAGLLPVLKRMRDNAGEPPLEALLHREDGLKWATPKTDKMQVTSGALSTRYIIHETVKQRRAGREYIHAKPYVRIMARLAPVPQSYADVIPPFNPFKLYANNKPVGSEDDEQAASDESRDVSIKVVELLGGILPGEDGQELDNEEVNELVEKTEAASAEAAPAASSEASTAEAGQTAAQDGSMGAASEAQPPNTTVLAKSAGEDDDVSVESEGLQRTVRTVGQGDKLQKILTDAGAETWQAKSMIESMQSVFPEKGIEPGQEIHIALEPSITRQNKMEPVRFSVFAEGHIHKVTVSRGPDGEYVASATPLDDQELTRVALGDGDQSQPSSLYASVYHAALVQNVPPDTIQSILRVNAYDVDFRRRLRAGDSIEMFFDLKDESQTEGAPGELLYTAITAGGETARFWRFRTPDGVVDYYDGEGNNAKKFLMRKPVRGEDVRLTSGFGLRFHPLLNERRMHTGVDWATTPGTPILAAGNGVIDEAGRKGQYGNYIRIRHANGYQTAYGHMQRFAAGVEPGVKVRQGQVIGFVGSTGLSSGPHLHFEVLVNSRFVDPLSIQVPRERQLTGKELGEFQKERARIDDLIRRAPVMTSSK